MTDKIKQARRELFEEWTKSEYCNISRRQDGEYFDDLTHGAWLGFNAALDAVEIELPEPHSTSGGDCVVDYEETRAAIESANMGIKVK